MVAGGRARDDGVGYGGAVPAREMVTEVFGGDGAPFPRAGARSEYILVSWSGQVSSNSIATAVHLVYN